MKTIILLFILSLPITLFAQPKLCVGRDSTGYVLGILKSQSSFKITDTTWNNDGRFFVSMINDLGESIRVSIFYDKSQAIERVVVRGKTDNLLNYYCKTFDKNCNSLKAIKDGASSIVYDGQVATFIRGNEKGENASLIFRID